MMRNIQKIGGIAALIGAATNLFALWVFATVLIPNGFASEPRDTGKILAFLADNQDLMRLWNIIIYLVFGVGLIIWFAWLGVVMLLRSPVGGVTTRHGTSFST